MTIPPNSENSPHESAIINNIAESIIEAELLTRDASLRRIAEELTLLRWKRKIGLISVIIAGIVPLLLLFKFVFGDMKAIIDIGQEFKKEALIPIVVIISASILSFVIIYGILIKNMFSLPPKQDTSTSEIPIKEIIQIARKTSGNE